LFGARLHGGEPLMRPDFLEIYRAAHRLGFLLTVLTNGTLIDETIAEAWTAARPQRWRSACTGFPEVFESVTRVPIPWLAAKGALTCWPLDKFP